MECLAISISRETAWQHKQCCLPNCRTNWFAQSHNKSSDNKTNVSDTNPLSLTDMSWQCLKLFAHKQFLHTICNYLKDARTKFPQPSCSGFLDIAGKPKIRNNSNSPNCYFTR